jgi:NADH dehydrogenase
MAIVERIDPERKEVFTANGTYKYDFLVIATGSITDYYDNEVLEQHSLSLKSVTDALTIRSTLLREFEMAVTRMHTDEKKILLNFIIIGAGATGVEIAGALAEFKKHIVPVDYPELDPGLMNIHVIEASNKVLRRMSPAASAKSQEYLEKMGVKVWLNTRVENYDGLNVTLTDGTVLRSVCFIWSAGVKGAVIPGLMKEIIQEGNRYKVDSFNRVEGYSNIYALGDVAAMISKDIPVGHPLVALPAMQQGANLARNFLRELKKKPWKPFRYEVLSTIGRHKAVADLPYWKTQGVIAWFLWMFIHLIRLIGFRNRLVILVDWIWSYVTYEYSFRLITQPFRKEKCRVCEGG